MAFDVEGARKAGYNDEEIAGFLGQQLNFDVFGAAKAGYGYNDIIKHLASQPPKTETKPVAPPVAPEPDNTGDFMRGIGNVPGQFQETWGGAKALAGLLTNSKDLIQSGLESMEEGKFRQTGKESDSFTNAWKEGIGTVLTDWLPYQIGSGVGNLAETGVFMLLGGVGGAATGAGVGALPGAVAGAVSKSLIKEGIKEAAEKIAKQSGEAAAKKFIETEAKKVIMAAGVGAGKVAQAGIHGAGEVTGRAIEEAGGDTDKVSLGRVVPSAIVHGIADFFVNKIGLDAMKIGEKSMGHLALDIAKQIAVTGAKEVPAELIQTAAERFGAKLSLTDAEALKEYIDTTAAAFGMSVGPGAVGGARTRNAKAIEDAAKQSSTEETLLRANATNTAGQTQTQVAPPPVNPDLVAGLTPAIGENNQTFATASPDTIAAQTELKRIEDEKAASEAAKIKTAEELIAKADAGEIIKRDDIHAMGKEVGIEKFPANIKTNKAKIEHIRAHIAQQAAPAQTTSAFDADEIAGTAVTPNMGGLSVGEEANLDKQTSPLDVEITRREAELVQLRNEKAPKRKIDNKQNKLDSLKAQRATEGTPNVAGTANPPTGTSTQLPTPPATDVPAGGTAGPQPNGVVPTATNAGPINAGEEQRPAPVKTAAQQDEDLLNDLLGGGDSSLSARRTNAEISRDEQLKSLGKRYGLTRSKDEDIKVFAGRIKNALEFEKKREQQEAEGEPALAGMSNQELAGQELKQDNTYQPSKEQIEAYEENREYHNENLDEGEEPLPAYKELSPDDRVTYFQNNIPLGSRGTAAQHRTALRQLADFRSGVKEETGPYQLEDKETGELRFNEDGTPMMVAAPYPGETRARSIYNEARDEFGRKTGLSYSFPAWTGLSDASKKLFIAINKTNTALERDMAFRAVKQQIQADKAAEASRGDVAQAETNARRQMLDAAERARKSQPGGKVTGEQTEEEMRNSSILPDHVLESLFKGDIKAVLSYINEHGNGVSLIKARDFFLVGAKKNKAGRVQPIFKKKTFHIRNSIAMGVYRGLAGTLGNIEGLKVNVVYDANMIYDQLARYDANTNTLYFGPNGLNETTILHELTHAATVKIIHQFFTDASKLAPHARVAVEQLIKIASAAQSRLGSKYPNAFENLYEFIAYAMTDADFQYDLAQQQISSLATTTNRVDEQAEELKAEREATRGETRYDSFMDNMWNTFTGTLAYMYKLFTPGSKNTKVLIPTEKSGYARVRTAEEVEAGEALEKAAKGERRERTKELSLEEKEALAPEKLFDNPEEEKKEARIPATPQDLVTANGVSNLQRAVLREPGYKGNFLLEAAEMFQLILAAPEGGIEQLAGKNGLGAELSATKKAGAPKTAEKVHKATLGGNDPHYAVKGNEKPLTAYEKIKRYSGNINTWRNAVRVFQDDRAHIKALNAYLDMSGKLIREGKDKMNNVYEHIVQAMGDARNFFNVYVSEPARALDNAVHDFAQKAGYKADKAIEELHKILEAVHEPERRMVKYLLSVPLSTVKNLMHNGKSIDAAQRRVDIIKLLNTHALTDSQAKQLREELDSIVFEKDAQGNIVRDQDGNPKPNMKYVDPAGSTPNNIVNKEIKFASNAYVATGIDLADAKAIRDALKTHPQAAEIQRVMDAMQQLHVVTTNLNKIAHYWSQPVSNRVSFYGFENYIPLKGKPNHNTIDDSLSFEDDNSKFGRELLENEGEMGGRFSVADNPILQTMTDAARASLRAGRRNLTQSIKNAITNKDANGKTVITGKIKDTIKFEDRNKVDLSSLKGESVIFHYNDDGSIDILQVQDENLRNSIRRTYEKINTLVDFANKMTSRVGQMHTRYNYNFAPLNFVRDTLTNAWNMGASELGPVEAARYLKDVAFKVSTGGMYKAMQVAMLYPKGDTQSLRALETLSKKDPYIRDMVEYIRGGNMVSHLNGMSLQSNLEELTKKVGRSGVMSKVEDFNQFADVWTNMFELASRAAAYSVAKNNFKQKGLSESEARTKAGVFTKNLANFEQVGKWGKNMGAFYMFFRPAATGAVRAIEAVAPAFTSIETAVSRLPPNIAEDPVAKETYIKNYEQLQKNSRIMSGALFGLGMAAYAMAFMTADDDDLGRNAVATDNMDQWTRFARFHIPRGISDMMGLKEPLIFQMPWGFGLGAFAASGAQIAAVVSGHEKLSQALPNIFVSIGMDSFLPVPVSRIPISDAQSGLTWLLDSVAPSVVRPLLEFAMNKNGLGQDINSTAQRRMGDAYTGGDNIPEMWKDAAQWIHDSTDGAFDWSPNTLYFLSNSYVDGITRVGEAAYGISDVTQQRKDFSPKTDLPLFGSFFGSRSSYDAREFGKVEKQIKHMEEVINDFKTRPEKYVEYTAKYPMEEGAVEMYNKLLNEQLNPLRHEDKLIRNNKQLTPADKKTYLQMNSMQENLVKSQMIELFKAYGIEP